MPFKKTFRGGGYEGGAISIGWQNQMLRAYRMDRRAAKHDPQRQCFSWNKKDDSPVKELPINLPIKLIDILLRYGDGKVASHGGTGARGKLIEAGLIELVREAHTTLNKGRSSIVKCGELCCITHKGVEFINKMKER